MQGVKKKFFDFLRDKAEHGTKKLEDWVCPCGVEMAKYAQRWYMLEMKTGP